MKSDALRLSVVLILNGLTFISIPSGSCNFLKEDDKTAFPYRRNRINP